MKIAVILKQVPDTEALIKVRPDDATQIVEDDIKFVLNPYDEFAVEEALAVKDDLDAETIGICIGSDRSETAIRTALAMGLDRAILISDGVAVNADVVTQGKILAEVINSESADLVFCGREFIDTQEDGIAAIVAEYLNQPHVSNAGKVTISDGKATVLREIEGGSLEMAFDLPGVISCQKGLNEPRYPTLIAIRRSKKKEISKRTLSDLNLDDLTPKTRIKKFNTPPPRPEGKQVAGEPEEVAAEAIEWLKNNAKLV